MLHPWSITGPSEAELGKAMERLRDELPKKGWKIKHYGRNNSRAKSLELTADDDKRKFGVNVEFWEKNSGGDKNRALLLVNVVSACYEVPEGQKVDTY
ncbi:hypothetical protein DVA86_33245 [Streptomyces armeniacus]|uniref:Uncharacterized protein n=2 Tax=Streptomyces armeniacus TaxID=83291 RepID=A0A345XYI9_9ACTN|nr:hypothetical protein DVA86_33245 [Streptomyces armeniacus]